jgi:hypothetical protein
MSDFFKTPDFSNFGIIDNSIGPVPEAFLIKELAEQNRLTNLFVEATEFKSSFHNDYDNDNDYDRNETLWEDEDYNSSLWDEDEYEEDEE